MFYVFYEEGLPELDGRGLFLYVLVLTHILTLYHLIIDRNKEESLFSLWVKLKKKKIKEELEK